MTNPIQRLIRLPEVRQIVGLSRSSVYELTKRGAFPQPVKLSARAVAWRESDLREWIAARTQARAA